MSLDNNKKNHSNNFDDSLYKQMRSYTDLSPLEIQSNE